MARGEQKNIINEVLKVFDRFAVVNLEQSTYAYYLRGDDNVYSEPAGEGAYTELLRALYCGIYPSGDVSATLEEYLNPVCIRRQMMPGRELLQWEYEDRDKHHRMLYAMCIKREDDVPVRLLLALQGGDSQTESLQFFRENEASLGVLAEMAPEARSREADQVCLKQKDYQGRRVLVAEDNALGRELAEELLRITGAEVDTVANGKEAVSQVAGVPEGYYDLILMDAQMPIMSGYDAARAIRLLDRGQADQIPIVAMTADSITEDAVFKSAGMNACLTKPVRPCQLMRVLGELLA